MSSKRKKVIGLVVPVSFSAQTKNKKHAKVLDNDWGKRKLKYSHFELEYTVDIYEYLPQLE